MQTNLRSLSLLAAFLIGYLFQQELAPLQFLLSYAVGLMLFITFIGIETSKLKPQRLHIKLLFALQVATLISWGIPALLGYPILAEAFFYVAAAPLATASPVIISILKGKVEFITTAMVLSQLVFSLLMPFILPFVVNGVEAQYWDIALTMFKQMMIIVIIPAILACIVRRIYPKSIALRGKCTNFSLALWVTNLSIVTASSILKIKGLGIGLVDMLPFIAGSAVICACSFSLGYRLGKPDYAVEFSQALGQKNTLLTLMVASHAYSSPLAIVAPTFYIVFHNVANAIQMALAQKRSKEEQAKKQATKQA